MRVPRVFVDAGLAPGMLLTLPDQTAHHVGRVLRMRVGDALVLFDGNGRYAEARLETIGRRAAAARLGDAVHEERSPPLHLTLLQALSRGERMALTVQKATELGVAAIHPAVGERSVVRINPDRAEHRVHRWRTVAISACEQCGRNRVPIICAPLSLTARLNDPAPGKRLLLSPAGRPLTSLDPPADAHVVLLAGPEGGLSDAEMSAARAAGFVEVSLGPRILRTETAPLVALTVCQALWGDLKP